MLAVLSLAAISRSCNALAIAGPSFSAVARGSPSTGVIVTLALSRNANIGAPRRGTSSANGWGSGWHPAADSTNASGTRRRRSGADGIGRKRNLVTERDRRERPAIDRFALLTGTPIAEELPLFGDCVASGALDGCDPGAGQPVLDIARQIEHEVPGPRC